MENTGVLMKRFKRTILFLIVVAGILVVSPVVSHFCGHQWLLFHAKEIRGIVIDSDTSRPIEGAVVVAMWRLTQFPFEGFGGFAKVTETKSNRDGQFVIPAWLAFKPWKFYSLMDEYAPRVVIYKSGYRVHVSSQAAVETAYPQLVTGEELRNAKKTHNINPARMKKIHTAGEEVENISDTRKAIWAEMIGFGINRRDVKQMLTALEEQEPRAQ